MTTETPIVQIRNLHKLFGRIHAVNDVDLEVEKGEVIVIIGPSGSGKSTLLRCVNRLEVPDGGTISIDGVEIGSDEHQINQMRAEVGIPSPTISSRLMSPFVPSLRGSTPRTCSTRAAHCRSFRGTVWK